MTFEFMQKQLEALLDPSDDPIATLANAAAFLSDAVTDLNWIGFYLFDGQMLHLGPFCGKPACTRIALGAGVCGTALKENRTLRVDDVHAFRGHIACDGASRSELVVVLHNRHGEAIGVLDADSPLPKRFGDDEERMLEEAARIVSAAIGGGNHKSSLHIYSGRD